MFFQNKSDLESVIYTGIINGNYHHQEVIQRSDVNFDIFIRHIFILFAMRVDLTLSMQNHRELKNVLKSSGLTLVPFSPWRPSGPLVPGGPWQIKHITVLTNTKCNIFCNFKFHNFIKSIARNIVTRICHWTIYQIKAILLTVERIHIALLPHFSF